MEFVRLLQSTLFDQLRELTGGVEVGEIREAVRSRYADAARQLTVLASTGAELEPGCRADGPDCGCGRAYAPDELRAVGLTDAVSLGCGNPVLLAELRPGDVVLDLGSGGGLDVLLTARRVGPDGHAYGVDMTDAMLELANRNKEKAGVTNATFLKGTIEQVPLPDEAVDVVMSNCVINLAEDKGAVIREALRVLRPGGRLAISDMVELRPLPAVVKKELDAWAGCIAGTIPVDEYRQLLLQAGFEAPAIEVTGEQGVGDAQGAIGSASIRARKPARDHG
jgi:arsenite methyltransferase